MILYYIALGIVLYWILYSIDLSFSDRGIATPQQYDAFSWSVQLIQFACLEKRIICKWQMGQIIELSSTS